MFSVCQQYELKEGPGGNLWARAVGRKAPIHGVFQVKKSSLALNILKQVASRAAPAPSFNFPAPGSWEGMKQGWVCAAVPDTPLYAGVLFSFLRDIQSVLFPQILSVYVQHP